MSRPLLKIGDYECPMPSAYVGTTATLVDGGRNALGKQIGAVIREDVAKVEAEWNFLKPDAWASILKQFISTYNGNFYQSVTFYNQVTNDWETRTMYVNDRTTSGAFMVGDDGRPKGWKGCKIHLIEV